MVGFYLLSRHQEYKNLIVHKNLMILPIIYNFSFIVEIHNQITGIQ